MQVMDRVSDADRVVLNAKRTNRLRTGHLNPSEHCPSRVGFGLIPHRMIDFYGECSD
jgi:hypothetical protein